VQTSVVAPEMQIRGQLYARNNPTAAFVLVATKYEKKYMGEAYFIFDFSNILQSMLCFDRNLLETPATVSPNNNSIVEYKVTFTEIYYNIGGIPTAYNYLVSDQLKAVNAIPQHEETQSLADYIIVDGAGLGDGFVGFSPEFI
jgi:hypothetical protein